MEYIIKLTQEDLQVLSIALVELPYKLSAPLIGKINKQIAEQNKNEDNTAPSGASPDKL